MSKHLIFYGTNLSTQPALILDFGAKIYFKKRIQFWEWKLHRTRGRPILMPRHTKA